MPRSCRPNLGAFGPAPANQIIGAQEMTIMQFVKNHRRLVWYVKTAANEQWARFDLTQIFGVPSLETSKSYADVDVLSVQSADAAAAEAAVSAQAAEVPQETAEAVSAEGEVAAASAAEGDVAAASASASAQGNVGTMHWGKGPITKPVHKLVGVIMPPTRKWATDKTSELISGW